MSMLKLGLWNIDHPESHPNARHNGRFKEVCTYLRAQDCDLFIITEANAAMEMTEYKSHFSAVSPFRTKARCYDAPNRYHQVAIYDRVSFTKIESGEPINGILCRSIWHDEPLSVYGNVITIKDRRSMHSDKKYSDRLGEQLSILSRLATDRCVVAGDFNLRRGWPQKKGAYKLIEEFVNKHGWVWPTSNQTETVQHVLHSADLVADVTIDSSIKHENGKRNRLSDHPFISIELKDRSRNNFRIARG